MVFKGEVTVEVVDVWGGRQSKVVDGEAEVVNSFGEGFEPMIIMSDLSQFSLRKLACIHDLISVRQLIRLE